MGTRSLIAVVHGDNYKTVYCHWDGYLSHNGRILQEHYGPDKSPKANHLVALGNISSLGTEIGEKHPFSQFDTDMPAKEFEEKYGNMTTFYGRDRDEEGQEFITHTSKESLIEHFNEKSDVGIDHYSQRALARIWRAERFSWWLTTLMHRFPDSAGFGQKMQEAELDYLVHSQALSTSLAENYVGLPLNFAA
jgi:hypothetical protein